MLNSLEETVTIAEGSLLWGGTIQDRIKTQSGSENESKNRSIKLEICSHSGRGKSFYGHGLSAMVTKMSMQVSPPMFPCMAS